MLDGKRVMEFRYECGGVTKTTTMSSDMALYEVLEEFKLFLAGIGYAIMPSDTLELLPAEEVNEDRSN